MQYYMDILGILPVFKGIISFMLQISFPKMQNERQAKQKQWTLVLNTKSTTTYPSSREVNTSHLLLGLLLLKQSFLLNCLFILEHSFIFLTT